MRDAVDREKKLSLPLDPFTDYLERKIKQYGNKTELCEILGFNSRKMEGYLTGINTDKRVKKKTIDDVDIDTVDRTAIRLGDHLMDIMPDLYNF